MLALVYLEKGQSQYYGSWANPEPLAGEVVVELKAAALNHRDVYIMQGLYPKVQLPVILGSDGAGVFQDRAVLLNPSLFWGENPHAQSKDFQILGMPRNGTFAEKIAVPHHLIHDKPAHLTMEEAAALPLAGVTAFRALFTQGHLRAGQRVLVTGIGGGVATLILQFARAAGAAVWVTSGSEEKIEGGMSIGAVGGINYRLDDWHKRLLIAAGEFDLILDSAGGEGLGHLLRLAAPGGRIVVYGGSMGVAPNFSPQILFWKQLTVIGSTMGTDEEFAAMLRFVEQHQIRPVISKVFDLKDGKDAFAYMAEGRQFGKIIIKMPDQ